MADKITIFKEVFDYYYDGEITKEQLADLLLMHYETRWGDGVDVKEIEDKDLRMIWRTLQHSVIKSTKNAKQYEKQQNKKSALQDTVGTEFDIPKPEIENKPVLDTQITQDDNQCQPTIDSTTESLKTAIEEDFITDEDKYGERVMDFLDENGTEVYTALNAIVEYYYLDNENFKVLAEGANKKINDLAFSFGLGIDDIKDLETYCIDYNTNLYNTKLQLKCHNMDNVV